MVGQVATLHLCGIKVGPHAVDGLVVVVQDVGRGERGSGVSCLHLLSHP